MYAAQTTAKFNFFFADTRTYLLCKSGEERIKAITASSIFNSDHHPGRSCLDSQINGDGVGGKGTYNLLFRSSVRPSAQYVIPGCCHVHYIFKMCGKKLQNYTDILC